MNPGSVIIIISVLACTSVNMFKSLFALTLSILLFFTSSQLHECAINNIHTRNGSDREGVLFVLLPGSNGNSSSGNTV